MIDTNALLAFAFSIVASFTNVVHVPPEAVPQSTNDLAVCVVGRTYFPLDVYLESKKGARFWIRQGVVKVYEYPSRLYFGLQDPADIPKFVGTAKLSSNQVVELANTTIQKLIKRGNPLTNIPPRVTVAKPYKGQPVPSYDITWPLPENPQVFAVASMNIDARFAQIVAVGLHDPGFCDAALFQQISNRVYTPDPPRPPPPRTQRPRLLPYPPTNEVVR